MKIGFSIIMPNYNSVFLERAINSVINQIYNNWELIIIDNFSDNSPDKLIKKLNNKKIKYYKFNNHNNIAKSRNFGITNQNMIGLPFWTQMTFGTKIVRS